MLHEGFTVQYYRHFSTQTARSFIIAMSSSIYIYRRFVFLLYRIVEVYCRRLQGNVTAACYYSLY